VTSTSTRDGQAPSSQLWRGLLLLCLAGVVWGTIGPGVQLAHEGSALSVPMIGAYRAIVAVVALAAAVLATSRLRACLALARDHWRRVVAVGALTAVFQLLFFVAVVAAGVSVATVVALGFAPVLLLVVASRRRRRLPSAGQLVTVTAAVAGLLLVGAGGSVDAPHPVLGALAALGSGTAYALSADLGGSLSHRHDALTVTALTMSVATAVLVPSGLVAAFVRGEATTTTDVTTWLLVAYLGVVTMAFAYVLLFAGLRSAPSGSAVVATLLEPVTAVLIAVVFLDQGLTAAGVVGSLLILAAIASLGRQPESELQPQ